MPRYGDLHIQNLEVNILENINLIQRSWKIFNDNYAHLDS